MPTSPNWPTSPHAPCSATSTNSSRADSTACATSTGRARPARWTSTSPPWRTTFRAPAAQRPRGPRGHRALDRHPPRPVPGPRLLEKKVGLAWRKVGTVPAKVDADEQAGYLSQELLPRLGQAKRHKRTVL